MSKLSIDDFAYKLPPELIADKPLPGRDESRLLVLHKSIPADGANSTDIEHSKFNALPSYLKAGDVLVVNDTRVIPAKIFARRASGGSIRMLLIKPETSRPGLWQAMVTPIKRLKPGETVTVDTADGGTHSIKIIDIITAEDGFKRLLVDLGGGSQVFQLLNKIGSAPLPPYIQRVRPGEDAEPGDLLEEQTRSFDLERYQTVFAMTPGAVAAPTAGLHFSQALLEQLEKMGVILCRVTLHVGPGTFKPVETDVDEHYIEPEVFFIPDNTVEQVSLAKKEGRRVIAVGTTSLRALESAYVPGGLRPVNGEATTLYVKPGFEFKVVDAMITNFHLSRSSLLLLVAAFAGREKIMRAYAEAVKLQYRFYSYGDAMFIS